ncbi:MAG: radical SAM protein [Acidobacteria bacterium]|nr:radical SAM protein [Acidobacteriota bacterium]
MRSEPPKGATERGSIEAMRITEIFFSIQGESSHAGKPCVFVRLTGCSLRCVYCDTKYSYAGGTEMTLDEVLSAVAAYPAKLVEVTGGEPLEQEEVYPLMNALQGRGYTVMLETGGHVRIDRVPKSVVKIIDIKCPDSHEGHNVCWENVELAQPHDEFKFVISSKADYEWSKQVYLEQLRGRPYVVLFSPSHDELPAANLARWILEDGLPVRLQLQIHKYIWGAHVRGV